MKSTQQAAGETPAEHYSQHTNTIGSAGCASGSKRVRGIRSRRERRREEQEERRGEGKQFKKIESSLI